MNGNSSIGSIFLTIGIIVVSLYISLNVFAGGANALGEFYFYIMIGSAIFGLVSPKKAFFYLLFLGVYLDFFKRLMIMDAGIQMTHLFWVLGIAPATFAGIVISVLFNLSKGAPLRLGDRSVTLWTILTLLAFFGLAVMINRKNLGGRNAASLVNGLVYIPMLFVVPRLFPGVGELLKLIRVFVYLMVPSAIYLIFQSYLGMTWWEDLYMSSGLSIEARQYGESIFRVPGTMSCAAAATVAFSLAAGLCLNPAIWRWNLQEKATGTMPVLRFLLAFLFAFAAWRTFTRSGWIMGFALVGLLPMLRYKWSTLLIYISGAITAVLLVASAGWLLKNKILNKLDESHGAVSDEFRQSSRLATMSDRLEGYLELTTNSRIFTPFGARMAGLNTAVVSQFQSHNFFSTALIKYGYVPLLSFFVALCVILKKLHSTCFKGRGTASHDVMVVGLGIALTFLMGALVNDAMFVTFPNNVILFLFLGCCTSVVIADGHRIDLLRKQAAAEEEALREKERENKMGRRGRPNRSQLRKPMLA